ncbi:MAG: hypothetical protein R3B72_09240 [Polyangiaceae bacterium]
MAIPYRDNQERPHEGVCTYGPFRPLVGRVVVGLLMLAITPPLVFLLLDLPTSDLIRGTVLVAVVFGFGLFALFDGFRNWARFEIWRDGDNLVVERSPGLGARREHTLAVADATNVQVEWSEDKRIWRAFGKPPRSGRLMITLSDGKTVALTKETYLGDEQHIEGVVRLREILLLEPVSAEARTHDKLPGSADERGGRKARPV